MHLQPHAPPPTTRRLSFIAAKRRTRNPAAKELKSSPPQGCSVHARAARAECFTITHASSKHTTWTCYADYVFHPLHRPGTLLHMPCTYSRDIPVPTYLKATQACRAPPNAHAARRARLSSAMRREPGPIIVMLQYQPRCRGTQPHVRTTSSISLHHPPYLDLLSALSVSPLLLLLLHFLLRTSQ